MPRAKTDDPDPGPAATARRQSVIDTCLTMNSSGLNQGTSGNVSRRDGDEILLTPSGIPYETLEPGHIVPMDLDGGYTGDLQPSSEWRMHLDIYRARPEAQAVVHTHSAYATALSCLRADIPAFHYMVAVAGGDTLRCANYATFGTAALSEAMLVALTDRRACLLANHGMICFGPSLQKALWLAGEIETLSRQYVLAHQVGTPTILSKQEMSEVHQRFETYGSQDPTALDPGLTRRD